MTRAQAVAMLAELAEEIGNTCTELTDAAADYEVADSAAERAEVLENMSVTLGGLRSDWARLQEPARVIDQSV